MIYGNTVGGAGGTPQTYVLVDDNGDEVVAVLVDEEVSFDATANDIREGKTAVTDSGVTLGTKVIPSYHTTQMSKIITAGSDYAIRLPVYDLYDYTKFQAIICPFSKSVTASVSSEKVVIDNNVYNVLSADVLSTLSINSESKTIELGIQNTSDKMYLIRVFTYKEIY